MKLDQPPLSPTISLTKSVLAACSVYYSFHVHDGACSVTRIASFYGWMLSHLCCLLRSIWTELSKIWCLARAPWQGDFHRCCFEGLHHRSHHDHLNMVRGIHCALNFPFGLPVRLQGSPGLNFRFRLEQLNR